MIVKVICEKFRGYKDPDCIFHLKAESDNLKKKNNQTKPIANKRIWTKPVTNEITPMEDLTNE